MKFFFFEGEGERVSTRPIRAPPRDGTDAAFFPNLAVAYRILGNDSVPSPLPPGHGKQPDGVDLEFSPATEAGVASEPLPRCLPRQGGDGSHGGP